MYDYSGIAKAVMANADELLSALNEYIEKADDALEKTLKTEGYANPRESVEAINDFQEEVAALLEEQTKDLANTLEEAEAASDNSDELQRRINVMLEDDTMQEDISELAVAMYEDIVPPLSTVYIQETEGDMVVETLRERTTSWFQSWGEALGELMRLNNHKQITNLIKTAVDDGISISDLTRKILDGGWRNEYYQAKRVAVTEVLRAHSVAREEAIQQSPASDQKEWRHTGAHKNEPRPNHVAMDGQIVSKNQPFELRGRDGNTYYPMYPRDPILPASESVNCHCIHRGIPNKDVLGLSYEERKRMQDDFIARDNEEWVQALDSGNKAKAGIDVPAENEASKPKYDSSATLIDRKAIASAAYRKRYETLSETKKVKRKIAAEAKAMLRHRSGTEYEDLSFVDSKSGNSMTRSDYNERGRVIPSRAMNKMLKKAEDYTIIGLHNHPNSAVPSYSDFAAAAKRKYKYGLVACHDGKIYKYSVIGELNRPIAENALDLLSESGYSNDIGKMFNDAGIELEVL